MAEQRPVYLVSNDDGVHAPGLQALVECAQAMGEVVVVAPDSNRSGFSNALTLDKPLRVSRTQLGYHAVNGTPADCVHLALNGLLDEDPYRVVTGINAGANLGDDALYSGTVAGAIEGRFIGRTCIAFSVTAHVPQHLATAKAVAAEILKRVETLVLPPRTILNVNIPDIPLGELRGYRVTRLGHRFRAGDVQPVTDPRGHRVYWIGVAGEGEDAGPGTDFHAIDNRFVSITPLHADMTRHDALATLGDWLG
ncbi:MAG: 5'/3'-nucleotidase SurE [Pseudomonadota bacterium]